MNILARSVRGFAAGLAVSMLVASAVPASAQEPSESHLKAARAAIEALHATEQFDMILPAAAQALKGELIQKDPNLQDVIIATVDEQTLALASRRGDLERESASTYAKRFSEADLNAIAAFYSSDAGRKLLAEGPLVTREVMQAAEIWQRGVARDLTVAVGEALRAKNGGNKPAQ